MSSPVLLLVVDDVTVYEAALTPTSHIPYVNTGNEKFVCDSRLARHSNHMGYVVVVPRTYELEGGDDIYATRHPLDNHLTTT